MEVADLFGAWQPGQRIGKLQRRGNPAHNFECTLRRFPRKALGKLRQAKAVEGVDFSLTGRKWCDHGVYSTVMRDQGQAEALH